MGGPALTGASGPDEHVIGAANVASLTEAYTVPLGNGVPTTGVTVSGSTLYAASPSTLIAADLGGTTNCGGTPMVCQPLWSAPLPDVLGGASQPLVRGHVVYESSEGQANSGHLAAYDANGVTNCSGSPTVCQPLWTADATSNVGPNVDHGTLFITNNSTARLEAFDANGVTNCSGSPTVCQPLWTASINSLMVPAIADGKVYVTSTGPSPVMAVYDEAGAANCSGSPKVCLPLFSAPLPPTNPGAVDVSGGVAYVGSGSQLLAIDASGSTNCAGSPSVCNPLWTANVGDMQGGTPAVANGRVYAAAAQGLGVFWALDANGVTNCSGSPKVCHELFSGPGATVNGISPFVTNGLAFLGGQAWDATGVVNCPPGPLFCSPIWHTSFTASAPATVVNGTLLVRDQTGTIHAFRTH